MVIIVQSPFSPFQLLECGVTALMEQRNLSRECCVEIPKLVVVVLAYHSRNSMPIFMDVFEEALLKNSTDGNSVQAESRRFNPF